MYQSAYFFRISESEWFCIGAFLMFIFFVLTHPFLVVVQSLYICKKHSVGSLVQFDTAWNMFVWTVVGKSFINTRLRRLNANISPDRPSLTPQAFTGYFLQHPFYCVNISYLVDQCICPARSRSRQTLDKNVLSWALTGTGSVFLIRQVS